MRRAPYLTPLVVTLAVIAACGGQTTSARATYDVVDAFPQLRFNKPVDLQSPRDGSGRLFVVEQAGRIKVFANNPATSTSATYLDLRDRVDDHGNEMGLLGLAFHPKFKENGFLFVYYSTAKNGRHVSRVSRFQTNPAAATCDPSTEETVIEIPQPFSNHNGGQIMFGPDGNLYVSLGDGGSGGDPCGHGQNLLSLLGAILRISVDTLPYQIPPDNPFAKTDDGTRKEIYAYGLRNAWRFCFDPKTSTMWAADVGQVTWEEINIIENGKNYGWDCREGAHDYSPRREQSPSCKDPAEFVDPVWEYGRNEGVSVTGGYVYRGDRLPKLVGHYVFADYVSGRIWSLVKDGGEYKRQELVDSDLLISSFGVDENGEVLICSHNPAGGATGIYRLVEK